MNRQELRRELSLLGYVPGATATGLSTAAAASAVDSAWPVGSIFVSAVATNPATLLGVGTWEAIGQGRVLIGAGDSPYDVAGSEGGDYEVTPDAHAATVSGEPASTVTVTAMAGAVPLPDAEHTHAIPEQTHAALSVVQPYLVVHFWQRTA